MHTSINTQYQARFRRRLAFLACLTATSVLVFCIDIAVGPSMMKIGEVMRAIFTPGSVHLGTKVIVWEVRLPYSVMALLVGASLSMAGLEMQTTLNNPMASPFTLGVSALPP